MTSVASYSRTQSVTYVAENILKSLKDIIRLSGMDPTKLVGGWVSNQLAISTWLASEHLEKVVLEIYSPVTGKLVTRWDIDIVYSWSTGDGNFWVDTDQLRYAIKKTGTAPENVTYRLMLKTKPGEPTVLGWGSSPFLSTEGFVRHTLGSTIEHNGLGASAAYWRTR